MKLMNEETARTDELGGSEVGRDVIVAEPASEKTSGRRWVTALMAALAVIGLASAGVFGFLYLRSDVSSSEVGAFLAQERPEIERTARRVAELLVNYDSTTLEDVSGEMLELATGNFREDYEKALSSGPGLSAALQEAAASSRGDIVEGPDVAFRSASEAIALMSVTQVAQSSSNPGGQTFDYTLRITLIDTVGGGWKADSVEVISTQEG